MTPDHREARRRQAAQAVLAGREWTCRKSPATAFAPANIALCKYWGKRDEVLNLPVTSSLSLSLGSLGSEVTITANREADGVTLNGTPLAADSDFAVRLAAFLDLFRPADVGLQIDAVNTIPTAAGFASSASGFAAVVRALNDLCGWELPPRELSILARLGSGSASRSIFDGLVEWHAGHAADGSDSFAEPLGVQWPELRIGLLVLDPGPKPIGSRAAMKRTVETSPLYAAWPDVVAQHLDEIRDGLARKSFEQVGQAVEQNAMAMHATMIAARPSVLYWVPESVATLRRIAALRQDGLPVYATMDAGPNVKLLFLESAHEAVTAAFPGILLAPCAGAA